MDKTREDVEQTSNADRERALNRIRELRKPLPDGWKFDRTEANTRQIAGDTP